MLMDSLRTVEMAVDHDVDDVREDPDPLRQHAKHKGLEGHNFRRFDRDGAAGNSDLSDLACDLRVETVLGHDDGRVANRSVPADAVARAGGGATTWLSMR
jgi:hypothetical protein